MVLVTPEIHWNTGNIGRTCLGTGASLHLIRPLGFSLASREVKRAGLDYWHDIRLSVWEDFTEFQKETGIQKEEALLFTKNGVKSFRDIPAQNRLFLIFGSETRGLPEAIISLYKENTYHIPIFKAIRSLNLSTAVGIALYESMRQSDFLHEY